MKRILTAIVLLAAVSFSACKKTEVTQVINDTKTIVNTVPANSWTVVTAGQHYTVTIPVPEIDKDMFDNGAVLTYISYDGTSYDQLPSTIGDYVFTVYHNVGSVTIDVTAFSTNTTIAAPGNTPYKIMLIRAGDVTN